MTNSNEYMRNYRKTHRQKQYYHPQEKRMVSGNFDNVLKKCLKNHTQSEIAKYLGISRQVVNSWIKKGLKFPKIIHYEKLKEKQNEKNPKR